MWKKKFRFDSHKQLVIRADTRFSATLNLGDDAPRNLEVVVLEAMVPRSYYLVVAERSTFTMRENKANDVVVNIPAGNYNAISFGVLVQQLLNAGTANGYTYAVTYQRNQAAFQISITAPVGANAQLVLPAAQGSGIHDQLGFDAGTSTALPCTSTNTVNFQSLAAIHLCSNIVADDENVLQEIYGMQGAEFDSINYHGTDLELRAQPMIRGSGSTFRFWLTDTDGNPLDLRGVHTTFSLLVMGRPDQPAAPPPEQKQPAPTAAVPIAPPPAAAPAPAVAIPQPNPPNPQPPLPAATAAPEQAAALVPSADAAPVPDVGVGDGAVPPADAAPDTAGDPEADRTASNGSAAVINGVSLG